MIKYLSGSLIIAAFILGVGFGYYLTPEYANLKSISSHDGLGKPDKYLDLRFINSMIAHHNNAIYMLKQVKNNSKRDELKELADLIIDLDSKGIVSLYALKKQQYGDAREIKKFNRINLGQADADFDLRFLNAMIIHHEEAIATSKELLSKSYNSKNIQLAHDVIKLLSDNLLTLKEWRINWYDVK